MDWERKAMEKTMEKMTPQQAWEFVCDQQTQMKLRCTTCSMNGGRRKMEDAVYAHYYKESDMGIFIVCDGMGGLYRGDLASQTVIDVFTKIWQEHHFEWDIPTLLNEATVQAKTAIDSLSKYDMGTTLVLAATHGGKVTIAHLGDSRAYYIRQREGVIYQTEDHVTIGEEGWPYVSKGFFNFREVEQPTTKTIKAQSGDRILLCSDGVYGCYRGKALLDLLNEKMVIESTMSNIVGYCDSYATDNYSAILIEFEE